MSREKTRQVKTNSLNFKNLPKPGQVSISHLVEFNVRAGLYTLSIVTEKSEHAEALFGRGSPLASSATLCCRVKVR